MTEIHSFHWRICRKCDIGFGPDSYLVKLNLEGYCRGEACCPICGSELVLASQPQAPRQGK